MLKYQGSETSLLGDSYLCSTRAFSGYTLEKLQTELSLIKEEASAYYDSVVVLAGTNDVIGINFQMHNFLTRLQKFLISLQTKQRPSASPTSIQIQ